MRETKQPARRRVSAVLGLTTAAVALAAGTATAATVEAPSRTAQVAAGHGCPSGYVCIYPRDAGWNGDRPSHFYYKYGAYNLSGMYGKHRIFNNQTGSARMRTCTGWNGTGCEGYLPAGWYIDKEMTPINSIVLLP